MANKRILTNGSTEEEMPDYREKVAGGQQKEYVVLFLLSLRKALSGGGVYMGGDR